jgi:hypothetical protein
VQNLRQLAEAREGFNRRRRRCKLSFDQLWRRFKGGDSFADIARSAGVTRSRLRLIYKLWFRKLLGLPSGKERREKHQIEKRKARYRRLKSLPQSKAGQLLGRRAGGGSSRFLATSEADPAKFVREKSWFEAVYVVCITFAIRVGRTDDMRYMPQLPSTVAR